MSDLIRPVICLFGMLLLPSVYATEIFNASFESGREGKPDGWETWGQATFLWDDGVARTGSKSLKIEKSQWNVGWKGPEIALPEDAQDHYHWVTAKVWVRTQGASYSSRLSITWQDKDEKELTNSDSGDAPLQRRQEQWVELSVTALPPEGAVKGRLYLRSDANVGAAWFDDVSLTEESLPRVKKDAVEGTMFYDAPYRKFLRDYPEDERAEAAREGLLGQYRFHGKQEKLIAEMEGLTAPEEEGQPKKLSDGKRKKVLKDLAWMHLDRRQYAKALPLYVDLVRTSDEEDLLEMTFQLGELYGRQREMDKAIPLFEGLLKSHPKDKPLILHHYGVAYMNADELEKAANYLEEAYPLLHANPTYGDEAANALNYLCETYNRQKKPLKVIEHGTRHLSEFPNSPATWRVADMVMGSYQKLQQYDQLRIVANQVLETHPKGSGEEWLGAYAIYRIARSYELERQYGQALQGYERVIREYPSINWAEEAKEKINTIHALISNKIDQETEGK